MKFFTVFVVALLASTPILMKPIFANDYAIDQYDEFDDQDTQQQLRDYELSHQAVQDIQGLKASTKRNVNTFQNQLNALQRAVKPVSHKKTPTSD